MRARVNGDEAQVISALAQHTESRDPGFESQHLQNTFQAWTRSANTFIKLKPYIILRNSLTEKTHFPIQMLFQPMSKISSVSSMILTRQSKVTARFKIGSKML